MNTSDWVTAESFAERYRLSITTVRRKTQRGEIPHAQIGKSIRYHLPTIDEWLIAQAKASVAPAAERGDMMPGAKPSDGVRRKRRIVQP